jgi:hypothetical protein
MNRIRSFSWEDSSKKGNAFRFNWVESSIFFFIDLIYNPFLALLLAMITLLLFSFSVLSLGSLGSVQLYWMHSRYPIFLLALSVGWFLNVNGRFYSFLGTKSLNLVRLGAKVLFLCLEEGVIAELRYIYGILFYSYQGVSLYDDESA